MYAYAHDLGAHIQSPCTITVRQVQLSREAAANGTAGPIAQNATQNDVDVHVVLALGSPSLVATLDAQLGNASSHLYADTLIADRLRHTLLVVRFRSGSPEWVAHEAATSAATCALSAEQLQRRCRCAYEWAEGSTGPLASLDCLPCQPGGADGDACVNSNN